MGGAGQPCSLNQVHVEAMDEGCPGKGDVTLGKVILFSQSASKNKRLAAEAVLAALPDPRGMDLSALKGTLGAAY